jgi:hypothetical protein
MSNDFVYNMSEINEEEIFQGWEEYEPDYIPGYDDGEYDDFDVYGEEEFA